MAGQSSKLMHLQKKSLIGALTILLCVISGQCEIRKRQTSTANEVCGIPQKNTGLVVNGLELKRGKFPWMAALILRNRYPPMFFCGGSLISDKHVVTGKQSQEFYEFKVI